MGASSPTVVQTLYIFFVYLSCSRCLGYPLKIFCVVVVRLLLWRLTRVFSLLLCVHFQSCTLCSLNLPPGSLGMADPRQFRKISLSLRSHIITPKAVNRLVGWVTISLMYDYCIIVLYRPRHLHIDYTWRIILTFLRDRYLGYLASVRLIAWNMIAKNVS